MSKHGLTILTSSDNFDRTCLSFADKAFVTTNSAKLVFIQYKNAPLYVQTTAVTCPFGFTYEPDRPHSTLSFVPTTNITALFQIIDTALIDVIMDRSEQWFGKKFVNREVLNELFSHTVKTKQSDKNYPPLVTVRLKTTPISLNFGVFDTTRQVLKLNHITDLSTYIPKKTTVRFLLTASTIWYTGGRCGFAWDAVQLQILDSPVITDVNDFMFVEEEEEEEQKIL